MNTTCTQAKHEAMKLDLTVWESLTYKGIQVFDEDDDEGLELRNCSCGSTLCKPITIKR